MARGVKTEPSFAVDGFYAFWAAYPRKVARIEAIKAWDHIRPDEDVQFMILKAIQSQVEAMPWCDHIANGEKEKLPHPATWLRGMRWEDEVDGVAPVSFGQQVLNFERGAG